MLTEPQKTLLKEQGPLALYTDFVNGGLDDASALKMMYGIKYLGGYIFYLNINTEIVKLAAPLDKDFPISDIQAAKDYAKEQRDDEWTIPRMKEIKLIWENLADSDGNGINTGPEDTGNLGGFKSTNYFVDGSYSWGDYLSLGNGQRENVSPDEKYYVCAVRSWSPNRCYGLKRSEIEDKMREENALAIYNELITLGNTKHQAKKGLFGQRYRNGRIFDIDENTGQVKITSTRGIKLPWDQTNAKTESSKFGKKLANLDELTLMWKNLDEYKHGIFWSADDDQNTTDANVFNFKDGTTSKINKEQPHYSLFIKIIGPKGLTESVARDKDKPPSSIYNRLVSSGLSEDQALKALYGQECQGGLIFNYDKSTETVSLAALRDAPTTLTWDNAKTYAENYQNGDWTLPSMDDLSLIWKNLVDSNEDDINTGLDDIFNLGNFKAAHYWGPEDIDSYTDSHYFDFGNGVTLDSSRYQEYNVRPVRTITKEYALALKHQNIQDHLDDSADNPLKIYTKLISEGKTGDEALSMLYGKEYHGGIIFYLNTTTGKGLMAAPSDLGVKLEWGSMSKEILTADGLEQGSINTKNIVNAEPADSDVAAICSSLIIWGHEDWFLPSIKELKEMHKNLFLKGHSYFIKKTTDENELMCYWSSTAASATDSAFGISMDGNDSDNAQRMFTRDQKLWVRLVRAF